ncbi:glycosyltransferase family 2 protein [Xenorhabdus hominickii]|uniref:Capsular biosynthesis protein n=1 Tax=Xenorhabdus hominickii TaxID=351679 RepID=A0A2G0QEM9_XENHO|nr:glycosyltransferase family 2 protein [Xenorhabdus hominickii]AOM41726.1 capsular biosynthesis protein [Xenorhabdus hominickii]PHM57683.1 capsular biosynthesis protein [Xenorhabdus hominickii]
MIILPMAGMSSRFFKSGYEKPKYMLEINGKTLFEHSINSFEKYFSEEKFIFVVREIFDTKNFIQKIIDRIGITHYSIIEINFQTRGQAETVYLGVKDENKSDELIIFNIDTFRPHFSKPDLNIESDGYLEVFEGEGNNWSFVKPINKNNFIVAETSEKNPISNLCCTGLYQFKTISDFCSAYLEYESLPKDNWTNNEIYIAPLYNLLIKKNKRINYYKINNRDVIFCGTPEEYNNLIL